MNRDMVWHELVDCMQNDNCPICELIHKRTIRSMDSFLYESVNDATLRKKICNSNGFCNYHAYMLMDKGDPLAHALIYNDLLEKAIYYIKEPNIKQINLYQSHEDCLFCQQARESENEIISQKSNTTFPIGTFIINITGAILLGVITSISAGNSAYLLLGDGFLGAYTTFSTFMYEGFNLFQETLRIWELLFCDEK